MTSGGWAGKGTPGAIVAAFVVVVAGSGCEQNGVKESARPAAATPTSSAAASREVVPSFASVVHPGTKRIVAIGDLHGDLEATRAVLTLGGLIDAEGHWAGGETTFVQTGDQLDRGDDEKEILSLLERLEGEAAKVGGAVVVLNGNHETMNVLRDFRYVTPGGFEDWGGEMGRASAFVPGGPFAVTLARHSVVAVVGDSVFAHGGVLPKHVRYGLDKLDAEVKAWMRGKGPPPAGATAEDAPVWTRAYSAAPGPRECATLAETLALLGAKRMVVGHTVQRGGISSACNDQVWRIDVGLARAYGGSPEALEIVDGAVRVLK